MSLNPYETPATLPEPETPQHGARTMSPPWSRASIITVLLLTPVLTITAGATAFVLVCVAANLLSVDLDFDRPGPWELAFALASYGVPVLMGMLVLQTLLERLGASYLSGIGAALITFLLVVGLVGTLVNR